MAASSLGRKADFSLVFRWSVLAEARTEPIYPQTELAVPIPLTVHDADSCSTELKEKISISRLP